VPRERCLTTCLLLDHCSAGLAAGRQGREAAEARSAAQIVKLADNNAALARMNNRLTRQLEDLRAEHDQILHLSTGRLAVARAKEGELLAEVGGLKRLLRDSMVERQGLRAQLHAKQARKCTRSSSNARPAGAAVPSLVRRCCRAPGAAPALQEVVRYLEWRLGQAQRLLEQQAAGACSPSPRNPLAAAFAAAAKAADGAPPDDSFRVLTDESGSTQGSTSGLYRTVQAMAHRGAISIPAASWAGSGAQSDKENAVERTPARPAAPADQRQALGPLQRGEAGDAAHANVTLRTPRAALAALPDPAPAAESPQAAAAPPHEGGGGAQDEAAAEAPPAPPASSSSPPLQRVVEEAAQEPQAEDEGGEDSATRLVLETPARPRLPADGASAYGCTRCELVPNQSHRA
jgi:hypothetical protein